MNNNINLRFDIGAVMVLWQQHKINIMTLTAEDFNRIDVIAALIHSAAVRGGSNISIDDIMEMSFKEFEPLAKQLGEVMSKGMPDVKSELFKFNEKAVTK